MKTIFVENRSDYDQAIVHNGRKITFQTRKVERPSGKILATGFTQIDDTVFEEMTKSKMVEHLVKSQQLVVHAEAPAEALLDSQILDAANQKVRELQAENASLKDALIKGADKGLSAQLEELQKQNVDLISKINELSNENDELRAKANEGTL